MRKIIACIIVCCILALCAGCMVIPSEMHTTKEVSITEKIQTTSAIPETYMELYVSKSIPKNTIIKNDTEHKILKIEETELNWVCTVSESTWDAYCNNMRQEFRQKINSIILERCSGINVALTSCNIDQTFSSVQLRLNFISMTDAVAKKETWNSSYYDIDSIINSIRDKIKELGRQCRYTLFGDNRFNVGVSHTKSNTYINQELAKQKRFEETLRQAGLTQEMRRVICPHCGTLTSPNGEGNSEYYGQCWKCKKQIHKGLIECPKCHYQTARVEYSEQNLYYCIYCKHYFTLTK